MPCADTSSPEEYTAAVERVAGRALGVLMDGRGTAVPVGFAPDSPATPRRSSPEPVDRVDPAADLPGLRILGSDAFAPHVLRDVRPDAAEVEAAARAFVVFPPESLGGTPRTRWILAWRDWATAWTLARFGLSVDVPAPGDGHEVADARWWQSWSVHMGQLSSLALPGLDGPVHRAARENVTALARGTTRAMLRRDHRTAARIARWLAYTDAAGAPSPLESEPLLRHIRLFGGGSTRTVLDTRLAQHVSGRQRVSGKRIP